MERVIDFVPLLGMVQEYISTRYAAALTNAEKQTQLRSYIDKYLRDYRYGVAGMTQEELVDKLFCEMAEYSVLTPFLGKENVEEINVNAWNDIAITYTNGKIVKLKEHFYSPQHATDIVKRLLHHSGMIIDNATPMSQGHLPNNTRITALKAPLVDDEAGVSVSIRLLHPSKVNLQQIVSSGNATQKMVDFLSMAMRYQLVENKQKFIGQIMTSKSPVRSAEDVDEQALSYAEIKMLATGNPYIKEKMDLDIEVAKLKLLKSNHLSQKYALEDKILKEFPMRISSLEQRIAAVKVDIDHVERNSTPNEDGFSPMVIKGELFTDKKAAGTDLLAVCKSMTSPDPIPLGSYRGFEMTLSFDSFSRQYVIALKNECTHNVPLGTDIFGNIQRLDNALAGLPDKLKAAEVQLTETKKQLETAKKDVELPFPHEEELAKKSARLAELDSMLSLDKSENEIVDGDRDGEAPDRTDRARETPQSR